MTLVACWGCTGDLLGRSIELQVPSGGSGQPGKHAFAFDKVFGPGTGQVGHLSSSNSAELTCFHHAPHLYDSWTCCSIMADSLCRPG